MRLAAGRNSKAEALLDDKTISHSILDEALKSNSEFLFTDTSQSLDLAVRQSIVAYDLRTVICLPLRKPQVQTSRDAFTPASPSAAVEVMGALYLDSRFASRDISSVSHDILRVIATELVKSIKSNVSVDWMQREAARARMRVLVKRLLRKYGYPPDKQEKATQTVLEQAEVLSAGWAV